MKLDFIALLPELEIETDSEHGEIEAVFLDGEDVSNKTVAELVLTYFGSSWKEKIILETEKAIEAKNEKKGM